MALSFPSNPNVDDTTVTGGKTWRWDGSRWRHQTIGTNVSANNIVITGALTANTSNGTPGQVMTSNSYGIYWSDPRLDRLFDVVEGGTPANGAILSYNSIDDKYYVLPIFVTDTDVHLSNTMLDGGSF